MLTEPHLVSSFWYLDSAATDGTLTEDKESKGYATRLTYLSKCQTLELYGRLEVDLFNSDRMLINDVFVNIRLTRAPEALYLLGPSHEHMVHINILTLLLCCLYLVKDPLLPHADVLCMKRKAHYHFTQIKPFTTSSEVQQVSINNAFLGPVPESLLLVFLRTLRLSVLLVEILSTFTIWYDVSGVVSKLLSVPFWATNNVLLFNIPSYQCLRNNHLQYWDISRWPFAHD